MAGDLMSLIAAELEEAGESLEDVEAAITELPSIFAANIEYMSDVEPLEDDDEDFFENPWDEDEDEDEDEEEEMLVNIELPYWRI
jgi:hypothetical protein